MTSLTLTLTNTLTHPQRLTEVALPALNMWGVTSFAGTATVGGVETPITFAPRASDLTFAAALDLTVPPGGVVTVSAPDTAPQLNLGSTPAVPLTTNASGSAYQAAWTVAGTMLYGEESVPVTALGIGLLSRAVITNSRRELLPALLPGFTDAATGDMPSKTAEGDLEWAPVKAAGALTSLQSWDTNPVDSPVGVGFGSYQDFTWETMEYGPTLYGYGHDEQGVHTGGSRIGVNFTLTEPVIAEQLRFYCDTYGYPTGHGIADWTGLNGVIAVLLDADDQVVLDSRAPNVHTLFGEYGHSQQADLYAQFVQFNNIGYQTLQPGDYQLIVYAEGGSFDPFLQSSAVTKPRGMTVHETLYGEYDGDHDAARTRMINTDTPQALVVGGPTGSHSQQAGGDGFHLMFALGRWLAQPARTTMIGGRNIRDGMAEMMPQGLLWDHRTSRFGFEGDAEVIDAQGFEIRPGSESIVGDRRRASLSASAHQPLLSNAPVQTDAGMVGAVALFLAPSKPLTFGGVRISAAVADEIRAAIQAHPHVNTTYFAYLRLNLTLYDVTNALHTRHSGYLIGSGFDVKVFDGNLELANYNGFPTGAALATGTPMDVVLPGLSNERDWWLQEDRQYVALLRVWPASWNADAPPLLIPLRLGHSNTWSYPAGSGHLVTASNLQPTAIPVEVDANGLTPHIPTVATGQFVAQDGICVLVGGSRRQDVFGRLPADSFPAVAVKTDIPIGGVARVGDALLYRRGEDDYVPYGGPLPGLDGAPEGAVMQKGAAGPTFAPVRLAGKSVLTEGVVARTPVAESGWNASNGIFMEFTVPVPTTVTALHDTVTHNATSVRGQIWDVATQTLLAATADVPGAQQVTTGYQAAFAAPVTLQPGVTYRMGWASPTSGSVRASGSAETLTWAGFTLSGDSFLATSRGNYPATAYAGYYPGLTKVTCTPVVRKTVVTPANVDLTVPMDPRLMPVDTAATAPNGSGFIAVDDAAKTASLVWKFSDGSTKKLDLA